MSDDPGQHLAVDLRLLAALQEREHRLAEAERLALLGSWAWEVGAPAPVWSDQLVRMYGYEPATFAASPPSTYFERIHPDDRPVLEAAIAGLLERQAPFALDHRVVLPGGEVRWLHNRGVAETDGSGATVRIHGTGQDVTERRAVEDRDGEAVRLVELGRRVALLVGGEAGFPEVADAVAAHLVELCAFDNAGVVAPSTPSIPGAVSVPVVLDGVAVALVVATGQGARAPSTLLLAALTSIAAQLARVVERDRAGVDRRQQERRFRGLVLHAADVMAMLDERWVITYASPAFGRLLGYGSGEGVGTAVLDLVHPDDVGAVSGALSELGLAGVAVGPVELRLLGVGGDWLPFEAVASVVTDDDGVRALVVNARPLAERDAAEARIAFERLHDPVTGLPTRELFADATAKAIARGRRSGRPPAVVVVDLDRFEAVNRDVGFGGGDEVLRLVAGRLMEVVRASDRIARPAVAARAGGDEFLLLCEDLVDVEAAGQIARRVVDVLAAPFDLASGRVELSASAGVALAGPADGAEELLLAAEAALRSAKRSGGSEVVRAGGPASPAGDGGPVVDDLRRAVEDGDLHLVFQPQVALDDDRIVGVEALLRWERPGGGAVAPDVFIPLAEANGLIEPIGRWVLSAACAQVVEWHRDLPGWGRLQLAVNVSPRQFTPRLVGTVRDVLAATGLPADLLCLEVTENTIMDDAGAAAETLAALKDLGVHVSIDDFGTGYSSLAYLRRFALDELKVDKSFVDGLGTRAEDTAVVAAIVAVAHALDLSVVAEGVETREQLAELRRLGCESAQGYLFARPLDPATLAQLLRDASSGTDERPGGEGRAAPVVLVIDDDDDVLLLASVSLSTAGFRVLRAADGAAGLEVARREKPDCAVVDLSMGRVSGLEVCAALRADPATADITVVMLTAHAAAADKVRAFSVGVDDYIVKPFSPRDLVGRVRAALRRRQGG